MNVLLLTPRPQVLSPALIKAGDDYEVSIAPPEAWPDDVDFIVSYGYRHIIKEPYLTRYQDRLINIHISMLPWNRGADPNFWSWFDDTPKGVSAHLIDKGIDTGDILMQLQVSKWRARETLKSSYEFLNICAGQLFAAEWPRFRLGDWFLVKPISAGSYHKADEKYKYMASLPLGWDTPVDDVKRLGELQHAN